MSGPVPDELLARLHDAQERDARHVALLHALPDLLFRFDRHGTYLEAFWNEGRPDVLAPDAGSLVGRNIADLMPPAVVGRFLALVERVLADGAGAIFEYDLDIDGGRYVFEARIVPSGADEVLAVVRNVTDRKEAERELRASRARIVETADAERRRIERDLHDGAQQLLLGARLALRLARERVGDDPASAEALLVEAEEGLQHAAEELRSLAHGIHPAVLTDEGLAAALDVLARRAPVEVELEVGLGERLPEPVEAALYFVAAEGLTNVVKHAGASHAVVVLERAGGAAALEVRDDGRGGADASGSGIRGLRDRVEALGGTLSVAEAPGGGTRLRAEIPCA